MSRFHVHIAVDDLNKNVAFYSAVFGSEPTVIKPDYAKWDLQDPRINFAISTRGKQPGLDHVGIQAESEAELAAVRQRLDAAGIEGLTQEGITCCYARSDKYWTVDPQGIAWESFHSLGTAPVFGESGEETTGTKAACCAPVQSNCCS